MPDMSQSDEVSDYIKQLLAQGDPSQFSTPVNMGTKGAVAGVNAGMNATQAPPQDPTSMLASLAPVPSPHAFPTISQATAPQAPLPAPDDASAAVKQAIGQKYGFDSSLDSAALQKAMQESKQNTAAANMGEGANEIGWALARQPERANNQFYQELRQQANQPVANIQALRQAKLQDVGAQTQMSENDPNSPLSKSLQSAYRSMLQKAGLSDDAISMASAADLKNFWQSPAEVMAKLEEQRQMKEIQLAQVRATKELAQGDKEKTRQQTAQNQVTHDPIITEAQKGLNEVANLQQMADAARTNPRINSMVPLTIVRTIVNRVNPQELQAAGGGQDLEDIAKRMGKKMSEGTMTDSDYNQLNDWIGIMKQSKQNAMDIQTKKHIQAYSALTGRAPQDSAAALGVNLPQVPQPGAAHKTIDQATLQRYSTIHYGDASPANLSKAKDFLRSKNYGIE